MGTLCGVRAAAWAHDGGAGVPLQCAACQSVGRPPWPGLQGHCDAGELPAVLAEQLCVDLGVQELVGATTWTQAFRENPACSQDGFEAFALEALQALVETEIAKELLASSELVG